jgi:hypothetical protein
MSGIAFKTLRVPLALAALAVALAVPAHASAGLSGLYNDYTKDGSIDGCDYSSQDLNGALGSIPTDVAQYDPRFKDALNNALSDKCGSGGSNALTAGGAGKAKGKDGKAAADGSLAPAATPDAASSSAGADISSDRGFPAALIVLGGLIALILLGTGGVALSRNSGWRPLSGFRSTISDYYWGLRDQLGR